MQQWFESAGLTGLNEFSIGIRIFLALILGGVLGFERTKKGRPAGLRTYMLVSLSACLVMLSGLYLYELLGPGFDPSRMAAQVISGIGFLGAGTIMLKRSRYITGLTTAAGIFATACIGIACGLGFYFGALMALLACIIIMFFADRLQRMYISGRKRMNIYFVLEDMKHLRLFSSYLSENNIEIHDFETFPMEGTTGLSVACTVIFPVKRDHAEALEEFRQLEGILLIESMDT